jgi:cytidylate kinase
MSDTLLVPSIEHRLTALLEVNRQRQSKIDPFHKPPPVVTISREFGCEAFPAAERLRELLEAKTKTPWILMERALLDRLATDEGVDKGIFDRLGQRSPFFDDMMALLSTHWKTHKDYHRVLCKHIFALAADGNVIFVGRGCSALLGKRENTFHFRMVAPMDFKIRSISRRLSIDAEGAENLIHQRQEQRDAFIRDFLTMDVKDPYLYHLIFNNARNNTDKIAEVVSGYLPKS